MTQLVSGPWRSGFDELVRGTSHSLMIAAPFIKLDEARWVTSRLKADPAVTVKILTDFRADSIVNSSLDIEALRVFAQCSEGSEVISVPRLHAKVYVSDDRAAVVTSANLTQSGLEFNVEYGVRLQDQSLVRKVLDDMNGVARLGSRVPVSVLEQLAPIEQSLRTDFAQLMRTARADIKRRFNRQYRAATEALIATQIGTRSSNSVFSEAIKYILARRSVSTAELNPLVQRLLPDLCDDSVELVINGERYGKRWKHQVRNAQQGLKRAGLISFDGRRWAMAQKP